MKTLILKKQLLGLVLAALPMTVVTIAVTRSASAQTSVALDSVGDVDFRAPAFQDIVRGEIQKKSGSFVLRMEMAGPIPERPPLPPPGNSEIWWAWAFDLDPTTAPKGYPFAPGYSAPAELLVYVSWDGTEFRGYAIDRRPLLTGGNAIVTHVPFSITGPIVEGVLASVLIDNTASFRWGTRTFNWSSSHLGTQGFNAVDVGGADFNPFP